MRQLIPSLTAVALVAAMFIALVVRLPAFIEQQQTDRLNRILITAAPASGSAVPAAVTLQSPFPYATSLSSNCPNQDGPGWGAKTASGSVHPVSYEVDR